MQTLTISANIDIRAPRDELLLPGRRIAHERDTGNSRTTWSVQDCAAGTRLLYEETFELNDDQDRETILPAAQRAVREWLSAIKLYLEWRAERLTRAWRWLYDRAFLRMPMSQRRLVMAIVVMHIVSAISFIAAALVWGVALRR